jgi:transcriptional regulator with XRE-family HTH domain
MPGKRRADLGTGDEAWRTRLTELRERRGVRQVQLAKMVGVTQSTISEWETGKAGITLDHAIAVAVALGATMNELLGTVPFQEPPLTETDRIVLEVARVAAARSSWEDVIQRLMAEDPPAAS